MEFNPYKDLIIPMVKHQGDRKPIEVEEFKFPEFNLRLRQVEYDRSVKLPKGDPPKRASGDEPNQGKPHPVRSNEAVDAGVDPANPSNQVAATSQGTNLTGGGRAATLRTPEGGIPVKNDNLPGGEGTLRSDGVVVAKDGSLHPPGSRANPIARDSGDVPLRETPDTDAKSQHNPENISKSKSDLANKMMMGVMLLPAFLPLALLLAAFVQGEVACNQLDGKEFSIDSAVSARQPTYPDGTPDFIKNTFSINKTKVKIGFSPCVKILNTDKIKIHDSNVFDGHYEVSTGEECSLIFDLGKEYASANTFSNTAQFTLSTSCSDRMAYAAGQDALAVSQAAGTGLQGFFSGIFGSASFSGFIMIVLFILAGWLAFKAIAVFRGS
jgi:hypothetical protein